MNALAIPFGQLVIFLALAGVAGIVAAVGRRAGPRLDVLAAISYE